MVNKHTARCSTSCVIRDMQIKTMRYAYAFIRMAKIWTMDHPKCHKDVEQQGLLHIAGEKAKTCSHFGRQFSSTFIKVNILLPYDAAIILPGVYLEVLKAYVHLKPTRSCLEQPYS